MDGEDEDEDDRSNNNSPSTTSTQSPRTSTFFSCRRNCLGTDDDDDVAVDAEVVSKQRRTHSLRGVAVEELSIRMRIICSLGLFN